MNLYEDLQWRGLIQDISSPELIDKLNNSSLTFYIGTDPTADSLHIGHYSSFLICRRLQQAGHHPILLVGMATGLIGDPKGIERKKADFDVIKNNCERLKEQIDKIFGFQVVNNYDWTRDISIISFLRDYGKYININYMLDKDIIKRQMSTGVSYAEFSYMLLQAMDFKYLHENYGVDLQVAGSDQWGNITTGIELIRRTTGDEVYAMTMPLVTDSNGVKFGKSEGNAVWLDKEKTSPYELYQYLINSEDSMVITYLKRFTFLSREEIEELAVSNEKEPHLRKAHKALAHEIIADLHGEEEYEKAVRTSENLFSGKIKEISVRDLQAGLKGVPHFEFHEDTLLNILVDNKICSSKREAREFLKNKAISVNGEIENDENRVIQRNDLLEGKILVIRRGKKKYFCGE